MHARGRAACVERACQEIGAQERQVIPGALAFEWAKSQRVHLALAVGAVEEGAAVTGEGEGGLVACRGQRHIVEEGPQIFPANLLAGDPGPAGEAQGGAAGFRSGGKPRLAAEADLARDPTSGTRQGNGQAGSATIDDPRLRAGITRKSDGRALRQADHAALATRPQDLGQHLLPGTQKLLLEARARGTEQSRG